MINWNQKLFRVKINPTLKAWFTIDLILSFAMDREGDSIGEAEVEHQERDEEPDDVLRAACTSLHSRVRQFVRS